MRRYVLLGLLLLAACRALWAREPEEEFFRTRVAPIFERHCVQCHNPEEAKGKLALTDSATALKGGESGAVIEPGKPGDSLLLDYISGAKPEMPKGAAP